MDLIIVFLIILAVLSFGAGGYGYMGGNWHPYYSGGTGGLGIVLLIIVLVLIFR